MWGDLGRAIEGLAQSAAAVSASTWTILPGGRRANLFLSLAVDTRRAGGWRRGIRQARVGGFRASAIRESIATPRRRDERLDGAAALVRKAGRNERNRG
jgi:hypothetical protein